jgi:hypothetical protein
MSDPQCKQEYEYKNMVAIWRYTKRRRRFETAYRTVGSTANEIGSI